MKTIIIDVIKPSKIILCDSKLKMNKNISLLRFINVNGIEIEEWFPNDFTGFNSYFLTCPKMSMTFLIPTLFEAVKCFKLNFWLASKVDFTHISQLMELS